MRDHLPWLRWPLVVAVAVAAACVPPGDPADARSAENRTTRPASPPTPAPRIEGDESMAALTAEVRQLRIAVQELGRSQTEAQTLSMSLSAQQARIQQITQQLDAVRAGMAATAMSGQGFDMRLAGIREELLGATDRAERARLEDAIRGIEAEQAERELGLQQVRARESELSRALAQEENRWNETLERMEQLTR
jgi:chromosome segregation ATPase